MNNFIPYVEVDITKGPLKFLIDTGANKNYISPKHVNQAKFTDPLTVHNINGVHTINQSVHFNPFYKIPNTQKLQFYVFDFHPFFDGLIGYEALQNLKANIITSTNEIQLPSGNIKMLRKYPCSNAT